MTEVNYVEVLKAIRRELVEERRSASQDGRSRVDDLRRTQSEIDAVDQAIEDERKLAKPPASPYNLNALA